MGNTYPGLHALVVTEQLVPYHLVLQKLKRREEKRRCWSLGCSSSEFKDSGFWKQGEKKIFWGDHVEWNPLLFTDYWFESRMKGFLAPYSMDPLRWLSANFKWNKTWISRPRHPPYSIFLVRILMTLYCFWLYSRFLLERKTSSCFPILIKTKVKRKLWMGHGLKDR